MTGFFKSVLVNLFNCAILCCVTGVFNSVLVDLLNCTILCCVTYDFNSVLVDLFNCTLLCYVTGVFNSVLVDLYGVRTVTIIGALLSSGGLLLSSLAPNIDVLTFTYGVIAGGNNHNEN